MTYCKASTANSRAQYTNITTYDDIHHVVSKLEGLSPSMTVRDSYLCEIWNLNVTE